MKKHISITVVLCVLLALPVELGAQAFEKIFPSFLAGLVHRNKEVETLAMPEVEIMTVPEIDNQALYMIDFKSPKDAQTFLAALEKEDIPYITFPNNERRIALFYEDMHEFVARVIYEENLSE